MKTYKTGEEVPYGVYFSLRPLDLFVISVEGQVLEGKAKVSYRRIPTWLAVLASPAIGGVFVMAFPAIIFLSLFYALGKTVKKVSLPLVNVRWDPVTAHLTREGQIEGGEEDKELDLLEKKVASRREED